MTFPVIRVFPVATMCRFLLGLVLWAAVTADAQTRVGIGNYFANQPYGAPALIADNVSDPKNSKYVHVLPENEVLSYKNPKSPRCYGFVSHHDPDRDGTETFVGVQLLRIWNAHSNANAVHVSRNTGWLSRNNRKPLLELDPKGVKVASLAEFAKAHASAEAVKKVQLADLSPLEYAWHARLNRDELDSALQEHLDFWSRDAASDEQFKRHHQKIVQGAAGGKADITTENRLLRFTVTGKKNSDNKVSLNFECPPSLLGVGIRIYRPGTLEGDKWYFITLAKGK